MLCQVIKTSIFKYSQEPDPKEGADPTDVDSSEERDILKRSKKTIKDYLNDVTVADMSRIEKEKGESGMHSWFDRTRTVGETGNAPLITGNLRIQIYR